MQQTPVKEVEPLWLVKNLVKMILALPQEKVLHIQNKCMQLIASAKATIMELNKLLGKLPFPVQAVLPGRIHCRYLQQQQIEAVRETNSYQTKIRLSQQSLAELEWWKENLLLQNNKTLKKNRNATVNNPNGCFQNRLGAVCQGTTTGVTWSYKERRKHIKTQELIEVNPAILTFTKDKSVTAIQLQIENTTAVLLGINGGNLQSRTAISSQGNM